MKQTGLVALFSLAAGTFAAAATTSTPAPSSCTTTLASPTPSQVYCNIHGSLKNPSLLGAPLTKKSLHGCRAACLDNKQCISFGFGQSTSQCNLYNRNLISQGIQNRDRRQGFAFYNRKCFKVDCAPASCSPDPSHNLILNPSFDEHEEEDTSAPTSWDVDGRGYIDDRAEDAYESSASFEFSLRDPSNIVSLSQPVSGLEVGRQYAFQYAFWPYYYSTMDDDETDSLNCTFTASLGSTRFATNKYTNTSQFNGNYTLNTFSYTPDVDSGTLLYTWTCPSLQRFNVKDVSTGAIMLLDSVILSPCGTSTNA